MSPQVPDTIKGNGILNGNGRPSRPAPGFLHTIDSRTNQYYAIPISHNAVRASDLKQIKAPKDDENPAYQNEQGLRIFDPGFTNTVVSQSKVTYVDGLQGTIQYRGYAISDIVGKKNFVEVSHLLIWGKWPTKEEATQLQNKFNQVPLVDDSVFTVIRSFPTSGSIVGMVIAGLSALQSANPSTIPAHAAQNLYMGRAKSVDREIIRVMSSLSQITAIAYCHKYSRPFTPPNPDLSYVENFLLMTGHHIDPTTGLPNPRYVSILERLWTLIADHEMTCSTAAFLQAASSLPDVINCLISALSAGYGPLHGGAIEVAYKHIQDIGKPENVPEKLERVKRGEERLFGYGHRVYKVTDPRFTFISGILDELKEEAAGDELLKTAFALDKAASEDEYFTSRKLRPNADLFAGFAYKALGFPPDVIMPISCIARTQGFMAHWKEAMAEAQPRIWRPGQIYTGDLHKQMDA